MDIKSESFGQTIKDRPKVPAKQSETPPGAEVSTLAQAKKTQEVTPSTEVSAKAQLKVSILEASANVSISAGNEPMALLFKTAIEGINEALKGQLGDNAIQKAYDQGIDVSPKATADRIVGLSTGFFEQYKANHADMSVEDALNSFVGLIGGGIDKGFGEARDILSGLNVLDQGNIGGNIDETYKLVQEGLKSFVENYKNSNTSTSASSDAAVEPKT